MSDQALPVENLPRIAVPDRLPWRASDLMLRWEVLLLVFLALVVFINVRLSPYFLDWSNISDATFNFTEQAIVALPMTLLIIAGDIDLSVASIIALASTAMGAAAVAGAPTGVLAVIGLLVGLASGAFNGWLVTTFGAPSIIVTIGTMSLFRGISYIVLGDQVYNSYPEAFAYFGQGYVAWVLSFEFCLFVALTVAFGLLLHRTSFGRRVFAIGNNATAALFAGIDVRRYRMSLFMLVGLLAGLASVLLTSRLGSTRPNIATAWELDIITMAVLGGVNINGGSGTILGVFIAAFIMGFLTYGMGLVNMPGIEMTVLIGTLLIVAIALPIIIRKLLPARRKGA
ncbi:MAG TPA: ABC transporter permease [Acetobacteraceae bacterium]|jgi:rhamnose transport system permease protein|nr:ABC transporter permease [Acetobacteraceae bacterium]